MPKKLSDRLSLIASFVPRGKSVCDIGCDHGYLSAYLCLSGISENVTAADIRRMPLENAEKNLKRLGADSVKTVLCNGLSGISRKEADTVIIAGMGGDVINGILSCCDYIKDSEITLILQPMTAADSLRRYLAKEGFAVEAEKAVFDSGKIYSVMKCRFCAPYEIDFVRERIGILSPCDGDNRAYIKKQADICLKCGNELASVNRSSAEKYKKAAADILKILNT